MVVLAVKENFGKYGGDGGSISVIEGGRKQ